MKKSNNMKELELKHLAAYLPYGLKCHAMGEWESGTEYDDKPNPITFVIRGVLGNKVSIKNLSNNQKELIHITDCFPILRPLTDLTKEWLKNKMQLEYEAKNFNCSCTYFETVQKLLEHHFDIFNLIDAGLAIDINSTTD